MFWSAGCSLLRTEDSSCSLDILYGGLEIRKFKFLIKKISNFFSCGIFPNFYLLKPWIRIRIGIQPKMLDPNPESINPDSKHWKKAMFCHVPSYIDFLMKGKLARAKSVLWFSQYRIRLCLAETWKHEWRQKKKQSSFIFYKERYYRYIIKQSFLCTLYTLHPIGGKTTVGATWCGK
jgi:hypothetical protein